MVYEVDVARPWARREIALDEGGDFVVGRRRAL